MHRSLPTSLFLFLTLAGAVTGCSDDETSTGGTAAEGVTLSGRITVVGLGTHVPGAKICAVDPVRDCVFTDDDGNYVYPGLPKNTRIRVEATADSLLPAVALFDIGEANDVLDAPLFPADLAMSVFSDAGVNLDLTKGHIAVLIFGPEDTNAAGYSFAVSPTSGQGPYYAEGLGLSTTRTFTDNSGTGVFANLDDGDYTVTVSGIGPCNQYLTAYDGNNAIPAHVQAGFLAYATLQCVSDPSKEGTGGGGGS